MNLERLYNIDRRIIYLCMLFAVALPITFKLALKPARMKAAEDFYRVVENLDTSTPGIVLVALDFGPGTKAENEAQAEVIVEHLFRRRLPIAVFSLVPIAEPFLVGLPERVVGRLMKEFPEERWEYGKDWVNLGYRPGASLFIQALSKSQNLSQFLKKDSSGRELESLPIFQNIKGFTDVKFLGQFTGLVGVLDTYIQFFQAGGYVPPIGHGCTSITIPEAYIYLDSGQLRGVLEGISGAAWYSELLRQKNSGRSPDNALISNTALGIAQLIIVALILFGNLGSFFSRRESRNV